MLWLFYCSLYALFAGIISVLIKLVGKNFYFLEMGMYLSFISSIILFIASIPHLHSFKYLNLNIIPIGILYGVFNYYVIKATLAYDNPGIISALLRSQIVLTFFVTYLISKKKKLNYLHLTIIVCLFLGSLLTIINFKKDDCKTQRDKIEDKKNQIIKKLDIPKKDIKSLDNKQIKNIIKQNVELKDLDSKRCFKYFLEFYASKDNQINNNKYSWIIYSIIAIILISLYDIFSKSKPKKLESSVQSFIIMICYFIIFTILNFGSKIINRYRKIKKEYKPINVEEKYKNISKFKKYSQLILLGVFFTFMLYFLNKSLEFAPYPAAAKGIGASSVAISLILSFLFFKEFPNLMQILGTIVILGSSLALGFL